METKMMLLTKTLNLMTDTEDKLIALKEKNNKVEEEKEKLRIQNQDLEA